MVLFPACSGVLNTSPRKLSATVSFHRLGDTRLPTCAPSPLLNRGAAGVPTPCMLEGNGMQLASAASTLTLEAERPTPAAESTVASKAVPPARADDGATPAAADVREEAVRVILAEAAALQALADRIDDTFEKAVRLIEALPRGGRVLVCGVGKSGHVARKFAATLASSGTPALFLHAAEALHGDLGVVSVGDVGLCFSNSGATEETLAVARALRDLQARTIAVTASSESPLGRACDVALSIGRHAELDHNGLAPTASTAAMMALGDALAVVLSARRAFSRRRFARLHPGGQLGAALRAEPPPAPDP